MNEPIYHVHEIFHSLKGEGKWTGTPMRFIRLHGCNLKCDFCDTDFSQDKPMTAQAIMDELLKLPWTPRIVITGGEPCMQPIEYLCQVLQGSELFIHLETNGMFEPPQTCDWVALSPKNLKLNTMALKMADEIKFVFDENTPQFINEFTNKYHRFSMIDLDCQYYVMPKALGVSNNDLDVDVRGPSGLNQKNITAAINYCKENSGFSLCMQLHKVLNIP